jgi:capsular polysaccharide biosynthesis protein
VSHDKKFQQPGAGGFAKGYGWLLRAYPPAHRKEYGPAMAQLFRDQGCDAWSESQGWGMVKLWLRVLPDLMKTSIIERLAALSERKSMSDKMTALIQPRTVFLKVFVVVFLLVLGYSIAVAFLLPETYASTARIKVENEVENIPPTVGYDPYFIQTTFEIMQSQLVLSNVIAALNLNVEWGKRYFAGRTLKTTETMDILKQRIQIAPVRNTKLISITVYCDYNEEAARIANAIAESYRDYRVNSRAELASKTIDRLQ